VKDARVPPPPMSVASPAGVRRQVPGLGRLTAAWNSFFHQPEPVIGIAFFRILWGLALLLNWVLLGPDVLTWFGERGVLSSETARWLIGSGRLNLLAILPRSDAWAITLFSATALASVSLTVGFMTRASALVVFLGLVSMHHRNILILNSGDTLLRVVTFLLIFSPAGEALSVDRWRRARRGQAGEEPPWRSPWVRRLIQIQVAVLYLSAFLWKMQGAMWLDGTAVYYMSRLVEFQRFSLPFWFAHLWAVKVMTWGSLFVEFGLGVLVWIRPLRYPLLIAGALLHLGVEYTMNIPVFQWLMIISLTIFIEPAHLAAAAGRLRGRPL